MSRPTLRLVVGNPDEADQHVELPMSSASTLHVHLHLGAVPASLVPPPPSDVAGKSGRSEKGWGRMPLLACAACALALVGYEAGSHTGSGRPPVARPLPAAPQAAFTLLNPGELPPAVRQQLALPPVLTPPQGAPAAAGAGNPFGLHP